MNPDFNCDTAAAGDFYRLRVTEAQVLALRLIRGVEIEFSSSCRFMSRVWKPKKRLARRIRHD